MSPILILFYLTAAVLFAIGFFLTRQRRPSSRDETRRERKSNGHFFMIVAAVPLALGYATQFYSSNESTTDSATSEISSLPPPPTKTTLTIPDTPPPGSDVVTSLILCQQAVELLEAGQLDDAMTKVTAAYKLDPKDWTVYFVRGNIYAKNQQWDLAEKDYQTALQMNPQNSSIKYNLADIQFLQKKYGDAKPGFVDLEQEPNLGDISTYKAFLCDLYGGHVDVAEQDLKALSQTDSSASYYFSNAAWSLYQQKTEDAQNWLASAQKIFSTIKFNRYAASLHVLGYPDKLDPNAISPSPLKLQ